MKETIIIWSQALWPYVPTFIMFYMIVGLILAYKCVGDLLWWDSRKSQFDLIIITLFYMLFWPIEFFLPDY